MTRHRLLVFAALRWTLAALLALAALSLTAVSLQADDPPAAKRSGSLDDELFKELEDKPAEAKPKPAPAPKEKKDSAPPGEADQPSAGNPSDSDEPAPSDLDRELLRELGGAESDRGSADPLDRITGRMREVEKRLARARPEVETRQMQEEIVAGLDELIQEALRRAQQSSQSSGNSDQQSSRSKVNQPQTQSSDSAGGEQSQQPAEDSTERLGRDQLGRPDPGEVRDLAKQLWGHLPEREREEMINNSIEQFLPKYEMLIEKYFRRLAEEQQQRGR